MSEKIDIIDRYENGETQTSIAKSYKRNQSTIGTVISQKSLILNRWETQSVDKKRMKLRQSPFHAIEEKLNEYLHLKNSHLPISGNILKVKALDIAKEKGFTSFRATDGWFSRFKVRYNLKRKRICGEAGSVDLELISSWKDRLPSILQGYKAYNIFNIDESAFFYRMIAHNTLGKKGETCSGLKVNKSRVTACFLVNMDGSFKYPTIIIDKTKKTVDFFLIHDNILII